MDEYLDLVNENDEVIDRMLRSEIYARGLKNYRVINAFIVNSEGKLWIPRRTADKKIAPLGLDFSVGGHVESGMTYEETFAKETMEELNIDVNAVPYRELGYFKQGEFKRGDDGENAFMKVYEIRQDDAPEYNRADFIEYFWFTPQEVVERVLAGDKAKTDLPLLIRRFYLPE